LTELCIVISKHS